MTAMSRQRRLSGPHRGLTWLLPLFAMAVAPGYAHADQATITVNADQALRFGSFVVTATGSRTVSASGTVTSNGVFSAGNDPAGPAQFTMTYDRGVDASQSIAIIVQVLLSGSASVTQAGVTGTLSNYDTDLPGITLLTPGQSVLFTIANCTQRRCSQTFHIGARLDVTRNSGTAALVLPLPVTANVLAVL